MAIIQQAIEFARSVLNLCARVFHRRRVPTDDEIRGICSQLLTANDSDFESVVQEVKKALRRRLGLPMSSYRHSGANDGLFAFRYVLRLRQRQPTNLPDAGSLEEQLKRRDKSAIVDDIARNERQKMSLLVEHRRILGDVSKELIEDSRDLVARTKKLIAQSKETIAKRKSA